MSLFEQSEATAARRKFKFVLVDDTDGKTPEHSLTFSGSEVQWRISGGTYAALTNIGSISEVDAAGEDAEYEGEFTATELANVGFIYIKVKKSGVRTTVMLVGQVVAYDPWASPWAAASTLGKTYGLTLAEINAAQVIRIGQFQSGSTTQSLVLDASASTVDDFYNRTCITVATGSSLGQNRLINDYDGATKTAYLDRPLFVGAPANGDFYAIDSRGNARSASDILVGLAQGGAAGYIDLATTESSIDGFYDRAMILIESGTGAGQTRQVNVYTGSSRRATVTVNWITAPDSTSRYVALPFASVSGGATAGDVADAVWDEARAGHVTAGTFGEGVSVASLLTAALDSIVAQLMAYSHDTGLTIKGAFRRMDAMVAGKATGLRGVVATFFRRDGTTKAVEANQDVASGTRSTGDVTGSES